MAQIGVWGLGPMGQNLALNLLEHRYQVVVANRTVENTKKFVKKNANPLLSGAANMREFISLLNKPRVVLLMVKAGAAVDATLEDLLSQLEPGDVIIDGGNSFFEDTNSRAEMLHRRGIHFLGAGISGGELGARLGPSIMVGGAEEGWELAGKILEDISAKNRAGQSCCAFLGPGGAGHYTKMIHNGIEYALMQLLAESYQILLAMNYPLSKIAEFFASWNRGEVSSYLLELAVDVLQKQDPDTGKPLLPQILDQVGSKGTGAWTVNQSMAQEIAAPAISEAVYFRQLSLKGEDRARAGALFPEKINPPQMLEPQILEASLLCGMLLAFAQGFALLGDAKDRYSWPLKLARIAEIWQAGCIIRAGLLEKLDDLEVVSNLIFTRYGSQVLEKSQTQLRSTVLWALEHGLPIPALASCLTYFDTYRTETLPANLLAALRDHFGAHTFRRIDKNGDFHVRWRDAHDL